MGGAAGHMSHPYEDLDLTFEDLMDLIDDASNAKLEHVTEKTDGVNIMFSWNGSDVVFARNKSDIVNGTATADDIGQRFMGRGNVHAAFQEGSRVIRSAVLSLGSGQLMRTFIDNDGLRWFSAEILYHGARNVIDYDGDHVAFHPGPIYSTAGGTVKQVDHNSDEMLSLVSSINSKITSMQKAIVHNNWTLHGPLIMSMKRMASGESANAAIGELASIARSAGLATTSSLMDYIVALETQALRDSGITLNAQSERAIVSRCVEAPGAPNLVAIKKMVNDPVLYQQITGFVKAAPSRIKQHMRPIDRAMTKFAANFLRGLTSIMMVDRDRATKSIKDKFVSIVSELERSADPRDKEFLDDQLSRLTQGLDIDLALEGIVFTWRGKTYKFTGDFSPVNQVLGAIKFRR